MTGQDTAPPAPMDFYKSIHQILRPTKPATYVVLLSAFAVLFFLTALLSFLSNTSIPFTGITVSFSGSPPTMRNVTLRGAHSNTTIDEVTGSPPPMRNITLRGTHSNSSTIDEVRGGGSKCDIFDGSWVADEDSGHRRPSYEPGKCPFLEDQFNCFGNGRLDLNYTLLRWQPSGCSLPRMDGLKMLEMLRGKKTAFIGDSLNRNMYVSLVCMLWHSVSNKTRVIDLTGKIPNSGGIYTAFFADYNSTIQYFRAPFLVREWKTPITKQHRTQNYTLRIDKNNILSPRYKNADILIFNTAHWWTHDKTFLGRDFYQEGKHVHGYLSSLEAYKRGLRTWARWVDKNVDRRRTKVFFRGYSVSHFSKGKWNTGGMCHGNKKPFTVSNSTQLGRLNQMMTILEHVLEGMSTPVQYLNITRMSDYRKDAHPSIFRLPIEKMRNIEQQKQDCSHWCLPGVPDDWNEILYTMLVSNTSNLGMKDN